MSAKRRVKLPGRFAEDGRWFVIRFTSDAELSEPLKASQLEDPQTGETGDDDHLFEIGHEVQAPWCDGVKYQGVIEFESERKEDCCKYKNSKAKKGKQKATRKRATKKAAADLPELQPSIKKTKKENNEQKKKTEIARQQTVIDEAEELFRISLMHDKNDDSTLHDVSVDASANSNSSTLAFHATAKSTMHKPILSVATTSHEPFSSVATTSHEPFSSVVTTSHEPISPVASSSYEPIQVASTSCESIPPTTSTPYKSLLLASTPHEFNATRTSTMHEPLSLADPSYSNQYFNSMHRFPSQLPSYPPYFYPMYGQSQNSYPPFPNSMISSCPSATTVTNSNTLSQNNLHYLNFSNEPTSDGLENDTNISVTSSSSFTNMAHDTTQDATTPVSKSSSTFLSSMSENGCGDCVLKDTELNNSREFQREQERDIDYWKTEALKLRGELDSLRSNISSDVAEEDAVPHYKPKRGICIPKCSYVISDATTSIPTGYVRLVDGHDVHVDMKWMTLVKGHFRSKTKPHCIKLMVNGFYHPKDMKDKTGMMLLETPLGKAISAYGTNVLGMDGITVTAAFNSKIGTMMRAINFNRVP